jgi:hypothetical protein
MKEKSVICATSCRHHENGPVTHAPDCYFYRAHQSETELLRKRVEKLRSALWQADKLYAADRERADLIRLALAADDKASESGV